MKRFLMIFALLVASILSVSGNPPQLRLSWNADHKVDLLIPAGVMKPDLIKVINEQGVVVLSHSLTEFAEGKVSFRELSGGTFQLVLADEDGGQIRAERFMFNPDSAQEVISVNLKLLPTGSFGERTANPANTTGNVISPFTPEQ